MHEVKVQLLNFHLQKVIMELPDRIKIVRDTLELSQKDMAKAISVSLTALQGYEAGRSVPGGDVIKAFVKLGFNANWLLTGEGDMRRDVKSAVHDATPGWEPTNGHPASKSTPPDGPEGYSDYELRFVLLRDIIETYEALRPGREPDRKAREITIIYRHFMEHFERHLDEVEIREYINTWM